MMTDKPPAAATAAGASDICMLDALTLARHYRRRSLSPVEVTKATLARIDALDPLLNTYCVVDHEAAMASAGEAERRWLAGEPLSPIDGVPTSIKDLILTRGHPTLRGSRTVDPAQPWTADAPATARLREAGAVLLGKTTTPEFGWRASTDSSLCGVTRNPWDPTRTPGGSSGGAAASVAAGMGVLAVGTDGGGSVRIPAAFTGTVGLKPQFGRIPAWPASPMGTVAHLGPHARRVADVAVMLDILARPDPRDGFSLPPPTREYLRDAFGDDACTAPPDLRGMRIAYSPRLGYVDCLDPAIERSLDEAAATFAALGAIVERTDPGIRDCHDAFLAHWMGSARNVVMKLSPQKQELLDPALRDAVADAARYTLADFLRAHDERLEIAIAMRHLALSHDLLLTPATAVLPFDAGLVSPHASGSGCDLPAVVVDASRRHASFDWTWWTPYTTPFNLSQQPAIVLPCGRSTSGLPIALQLVAPHHQEAACIKAAAAYEAATAWHRDFPPC
jgi:aspartyl-tRNA(Asn)/glutamyl-tRNA(Gln) amidotransferase subunit A